MTQQVMIKTTYGDIVVTLDSATGNEPVGEFLRYVGAGHWNPSFDSTVVVSEGTISITTWDNAFSKFAFQGTVASGQAVLDQITSDDATAAAVIFAIAYVQPPEPATQT